MVCDLHGQPVGYAKHEVILDLSKSPVGYLMEAGASFVLHYGSGYKVWQIIGPSDKAEGLVLALPHMLALPEKGLPLAGGGALLLMKQSGLL